MHKEIWSGVNPDKVVGECSPQHIKNLLAMALDDIAELQRIRDAAKAVADYYRKSLSVGPGV